MSKRSRIRELEREYCQMYDRVYKLREQMEALIDFLAVRLERQDRIPERLIAKRVAKKK